MAYRDDFHKGIGKRKENRHTCQNAPQVLNKAKKIPKFLEGFRPFLCPFACIIHAIRPLMIRFQYSIELPSDRDQRRNLPRGLQQQVTCVNGQSKVVFVYTN